MTRQSTKKKWVSILLVVMMFISLMPVGAYAENSSEQEISEEQGTGSGEDQNKEQETGSEEDQNKEQETDSEEDQNKEQETDSEEDQNKEQETDSDEDQNKEQFQNRNMNSSNNVDASKAQKQNVTVKYYECANETHGSDQVGDKSKLINAQGKYDLIDGGVYVDENTAFKPADPYEKDSNGKHIYELCGCPSIIDQGENGNDNNNNFANYFYVAKSTGVVDEVGFSVFHYYGIDAKPLKDDSTDIPTEIDITKSYAVTDFEEYIKAKEDFSYTSLEVWGYKTDVEASVLVEPDESGNYDLTSYDKEVRVHLAYDQAAKDVPFSVWQFYGTDAEGEQDKSGEFPTKIDINKRYTKDDFKKYIKADNGYSFTSLDVWGYETGAGALVLVEPNNESGVYDLTQYDGEVRVHLAYDKRMIPVTVYHTYGKSPYETDKQDPIDATGTHTQADFDKFIKNKDGYNFTNLKVKGYEIDQPGVEKVITPDGENNYNLASYQEIRVYVTYRVEGSGEPPVVSPPSGSEGPGEPPVNPPVGPEGPGEPPVNPPVGPQPPVIDPGYDGDYDYTPDPIPTAPAPVPVVPQEIVIDENEVPMGSVDLNSNEVKLEEEEIIIEDNEVPMGANPKTGTDKAVDLSVFAFIAAASAIMFEIRRKKA